MYKTEPIVADSGEVIIYAPHITDVKGTGTFDSASGVKRRAFRSPSRRAFLRNAAGGSIWGMPTTGRSTRRSGLAMRRKECYSYRTPAKCCTAVRRCSVSRIQLEYRA